MIVGVTFEDCWPGCGDGAMESGKRGGRQNKKWNKIIVSKKYIYYHIGNGNEGGEGGGGKWKQKTRLLIRFILQGVKIRRVHEKNER